MNQNTQCEPNNEDLVADSAFDQFFSDNDQTRLPSPYFAAVIIIACFGILAF